MSVFNALKEILSKSANLKFLAYNLLWLILSLIVVAIIGFVFIMLFFAAIMLAVSSLELAVFLAVIIAVVGIIVFIFASMFLEGILLNIARDFLEGRSFSFGKGIEKSKPRFFTAGLQQIIVGIAICVFLLLIFTPVIISAVSFFTSSENLTPLALAIFSEDSSQVVGELEILFWEFILQNIVLLIIPAVIAVLVFLALIPFLIILKQVAFFEQVRVLESIKRAWTLGFQNFFKNWVFFILYFIPVVVVSVIASTIMELSALTILIVLGVLVFIAAQSWIMAFSVLFEVQVYKLDVAGTSASAVQERLPAVRKTTSVSVEGKKELVASRRFKHAIPRTAKTVRKK